MSVHYQKVKQLHLILHLTRNAFRNIKINFVKRRHLYYVISGASIIGRISFFPVHGYDMGVDFKGGRTYVVRFNNTPYC